jgi:hypothetical protein
MGTKTKRNESNLEHRQSVLLAKREELIGRLHARRSEIVAGRESDDEAGIALQTVIRDFTYVSLETRSALWQRLNSSATTGNRRIRIVRKLRRRNCSSALKRFALDTCLPGLCWRRVGPEPQVWQALQNSRSRLSFVTSACRMAVIRTWSARTARNTESLES